MPASTEESRAPGEKAKSKGLKQGPGSAVQRSDSEKSLKCQQLRAKGPTKLGVHARIVLDSAGPTLQATAHRHQLHLQQDRTPESASEEQETEVKDARTRACAIFRSSVLP